jgi:sterol desaturase/sphingolipid hydroxylase (fatty acid hydroxylase superfamily)
MRTATGTSSLSLPSSSSPGSRWSWLVFPALLTLVTGATVLLLSSRLPRPAISLSVLLGSVALILTLERLAPLHRAWNRFPDLLDLFLIVVNRAVDVAVIGGTVALLARLDAAGVRPAALHVWPTRWPLLAQALLGIVAGELVRYGFHRLSHKPGLLGRVHRTHHEPERMYTLNGPRLHPVNQLWLAIANVVPMLLLGAALPAVILALNITVFFVLFQHANVRLRFDGLNRIFATPDAHRAHHLREQAGEGVNYGIVLLVFDALFGTWVAAPPDPGDRDIGLAGPSCPRGCSGRGAA